MQGTDAINGGAGIYIEFGLEHVVHYIEFGLEHVVLGSGISHSKI